MILEINKHSNITIFVIRDYKEVDYNHLAKLTRDYLGIYLSINNDYSITLYASNVIQFYKDYLHVFELIEFKGRNHKRLIELFSDNEYKRLKNRDRVYNGLKPI